MTTEDKIRHSGSPSRSRCIMVIGLPRSGTSATAGMLHKAGVLMERVSMGKNPLNPRGYFEDKLWKAINRSWVGGSKVYKLKIPEKLPARKESAYKALVKEYQTEQLWGIKDPRLCVTARYIWPMLEEVRVVAVFRDFEATVRSLWSHSHVAYKGQYPQTEDHIRDMLVKWREQQFETLSLWKGPRFDVRYEDLLLRPEAYARDLCTFAGEGLNIKLDLQAAAEHINPELNHEGRHPGAKKLWK